MEKRSSIIGGLIMIVVGILFLLLNMFPAAAERLNIAQQWPLLVVAVGAFFLLSALFTTADLAIPGSIISGIGGILYYQNATGNWDSWAYIWTLIPGFVGIGLIIASMLGRNKSSQRREGVRLLGISAILFLVFASFFAGLGNFERFWPLLLILLGVWLLVRNRVRG